MLDPSFRWGDEGEGGNREPNLAKDRAVGRRRQSSN